MTVQIGEVTSQVDVQAELNQGAGGDHATRETWNELANLSRARRDLARLERRIRAEGFDD